MSLDIMFPLSLSHSSLSLFWSCDLKGFRSKIQHLVGTGETNGDLLAGGSFASACELSRKAFYEENLSQEEAIEIGYNFIIDSPDTGHLIKTNERVASVFKKYIERFPFTREFTPCELEDGSFAIEYKFELDTGIQHPDFPNKNILFTGILDGLYEKVVQEKVVGGYVLDEKTTSRISRVPGTKIVDLEKEADIFRASGQLAGYAFAAEKVGMNISSGLIRRVPILTDHEDAFELEIPITRFMKDRWAEATFEKIRELVSRYVYYRDELLGVKGSHPHSVFYPNYGAACNGWKKPCKYIEGCLTKQGEQVLEMTMNQKVSWMNESGERIQTDLKDYKEQHGN